jgi:hypothetical protein
MSACPLRQRYNDRLAARRDPAFAHQADLTHRQHKLLTPEKLDLARRLTGEGKGKTIAAGVDLARCGERCTSKWGIRSGPNRHPHLV